ncbi:MAG: hypothetical protein K9I68_02425 [Bacteroidales bacterium]|nr:hypothetical protein [Bacteroidales bacterium]MCF8337169.1 hypothetical protein [Bacteroidales bacterium]
MDTLKKVSKALGISLSKASKIKREIEHKEFPGVPPFMVWGTGSKKKYPPEKFRKYLNVKS